MTKTIDNERTKYAKRVDAAWIMREKEIKAVNTKYYKECDAARDECEKEIEKLIDND